jgi:DNA-binding MarR family transcriptional regulator
MRLDVEWVHLSLAFKYLDIEILTLRYLDVKKMIIENQYVAKTAERDEIDEAVERWQQVITDLDPRAEGIVDRIHALAKKLNKTMEETLAEVGGGLELGEWKTLLHLRREGEPYRLTAGKLAQLANLSTGAMTHRLDGLEAAGYVRRLPDPSDRRAVLVELTPPGRQIWDETTSVQVRKEALLAAALSDSEKEELNNLLRRLMLAFD